MRTHGHIGAIGFAATSAEVANQFFARFKLRARGLVAVEIADETNAEPDVVHVIAVDVATSELVHPAIADLDLAVARGGAVADDEVVGESVLHPPNPAVIVIEGARVPLPRAAVVDDDEFPSRALNWCSPDRVDRCTR